MGWSRRLWSSVAGVQVVGGVGAPVDVSKGAEPGVLVGASPVPPEGQTDGGQSVTGGSPVGELMCPAGWCPPPLPLLDVDRAPLSRVGRGAQCPGPQSSTPCPCLRGHSNDLCELLGSSWQFPSSSSSLHVPP